MPDTPLSLLAAYLWDLRAQCERQLRCVTSAQRVVDDNRDLQDPLRRTGWHGELRKYISEVENAQTTIAATIADTAREVDVLERGVADEI